MYHSVDQNRRLQRTTTASESHEGVAALQRASKGSKRSVAAMSFAPVDPESPRPRPCIARRWASCWSSGCTPPSPPRCIRAATTQSAYPSLAAENFTGLSDFPSPVIPELLLVCVVCRPKPCPQCPATPARSRRPARGTRRRRPCTPSPSACHNLRAVVGPATSSTSLA